MMDRSVDQSAAIQLNNSNKEGSILSQTFSKLSFICSTDNPSISSLDMSVKGLTDQLVNLKKYLCYYSLMDISSFKIHVRDYTDTKIWCALVACPELYIHTERVEYHIAHMYGTMVFAKALLCLGQCLPTDMVRIFTDHSPR